MVLCANRLKSREKVEEAVVHELVHAYDFLVSGVKLQECQALAYRLVLSRSSVGGEGGGGTRMSKGLGRGGYWCGCHACWRGGG